MNALLPFVVAGLVSGSVYGLAGAGLVLTYKTSGVFEALREWTNLKAVWIETGP